MPEEIDIAQQMQIKDKDHFNLGELLQEVSEGLIRDRKSELSNKMKKLFYKIDNLHAQERRQKSDLKRTQEKLAKALELAQKLRSGDWDMISRLDNLEDKE